MDPYFNLKKNLSKIEKKLGYFFKNKEFLLEAFTHSSFLNENKDILKSDNERLEFLGDSVLSLIISEYLFKKFPKEKEGKLSFLRSKIVDSISCSEYVRNLDLQKYLLLGKGERKIKKRGEANILADLFESILGSIFWDGNFLKAKNFLLKNFEKNILEIIENPPLNYKEELQNYCQKKYKKLPTYTTIKEEGPEHQKTFEVEVFINKKKLAKGEGKSKKEATKKAAKNALEKFLW